MYMRRIVFLLLIVVSIVSCSWHNGKNQEAIKELDDKITTVFSQYGRKVIVHSSINEDRLKIDLFFKSPSFIDPETQKMMLSLLSYHMHTIFDDFGGVDFNYIDEGFEREPLFYSQEKNDVEYSFGMFNRNKMFLDQVTYVLNDMSQNELLASNLIIEELNRIIPNAFSFKGSFWLLLYQYSLDFRNDKSVSTKNFTIFYNAASVTGSNVDVNHLKNLVNVTNGDPVILFSSDKQ